MELAWCEVRMEPTSGLEPLTCRLRLTTLNHYIFKRFPSLTVGGIRHFLAYLLRKMLRGSMLTRDGTSVDKSPGKCQRRSTRKATLRSQSFQE